MSGATKALTGKGAAATRHAGGKYFWRGAPWEPAGWHSTFVRLGCQRARFGGGASISSGAPSCDLHPVTSMVTDEIILAPPPSASAD